MRRASRDNTLSLLSVLAALVIPGLVPQSAHGMYDPKHGRWLQRDPAGVRVDAPDASVQVESQYGDGPHLYEYVHSRPPRFQDPTGLWGWTGTGRACLDMLKVWENSAAHVQTNPKRLTPLGYDEHFILVFPHPFQTFLGVGYGVKPPAKGGTIKGGHEERLYVGWGAVPDASFVVNEQWLRSKKWVGNQGVLSSITEAYAHAGSRMTAFVDHRVCERVSRTQDYRSLVSLAGYPVMLLDPERKDLGWHWSNHTFDTTAGDNITDNPDNFREVEQSFGKVVPKAVQALRDFLDPAKCVRCRTVHEEGAAFRFPEESTWPVDKTDYPPDLTFR
jgi:hypothetical protein